MPDSTEKPSILPAVLTAAAVVVAAVLGVYGIWYKHHLESTLPISQTKTIDDPVFPIKPPPRKEPTICEMPGNWEFGQGTTSRPQDVASAAKFVGHALVFQIVDAETQRPLTTRIGCTAAAGQDDAIILGASVTEAKGVVRHNYAGLLHARAGTPALFLSTSEQAPASNARHDLVAEYYHCRLKRQA